MSQAPPVDVSRSEPEGEISLGRELRRAREVRGISLEQIAAETKINERYLHALENDRLDLLPGQLYARNFVRSIARTIGADEEELVDYFNYHVRMQADAVGQQQAPGGVRAARRGALLVVAAIAGALVLGLIVLSFRHGSSRPPGASAPAPGGRLTPVTATTGITPPAGTGQAAVPTAPAPLPAGGSAGARALPAVIASPLPGSGGATAPSVSGATDGAAASSGALGASAPVVEGPPPVVQLRFTDGSWVDIRRSGEDELVGIKKAGDVLTYRLDKVTIIELANAAAVEMTIDGQPARPLGGGQEKRTLVLDRKNYRSYLK